MNKQTINRINELKEEIDAVKLQDKFVEIANNYFEENPGFLYFAFSNCLHINMIINDRDDFTGIMARYMAIGEVFKKPYFLDETKNLLCHSENVLLSGHISGKTCQIVEVGKKEVPVYELKCEGGLK